MAEFKRPKKHGNKLKNAAKKKGGTNRFTFGSLIGNAYKGAFGRVGKKRPKIGNN